MSAAVMDGLEEVQARVARAWWARWADGQLKPWSAEALRLMAMDRGERELARCGDACDFEAGRRNEKGPG